jgi:hypothetical protein
LSGRNRALCVHAPRLQLLAFGERNLGVFLRNSTGRTVAPSEELVPQVIESRIVTI